MDTNTRNNAVTPDRFGKDHWSMFAYVETLCVDGGDGIGVINRTRVRTNENTHPLLAANPLCKWQKSWGSRLKGFFDFAERGDTDKAEEAGLQLSWHDDWDCLDDLEEAGFIEILSMTNGAVKMTKKGNEIAAKLREHKSNGGQFAGFTMPITETA